MSTPSEANLFFWNDPDDLLDALYRVGREPVPELRNAIARLLDHDDAEVREEALRILLTRWKDAELRPRAFEVLQSDPEPIVQSAAAVAIAATASDASRAADTRMLLNVLRDEGRDGEVRGAAYDALVILHRKHAGSGGWPFPTKKREFDVARDVDWPWVQSLEL
jgi:HEAT repeats